MNDDHKAVFLSYASQDAEAAKRICETLRQNGVEVWFDQSELRGGDAWDQKIRKQIKECALFVPIISAHTDARAKGYFRREWKLAVDCTQDMADDLPFLVPVVIDDTADATARVPEKFREVQWTRLRDGETRPAFCDRIKKLLNGGVGARPPPAAELPLRLRAAAVPQKSRRWLWPAILGGLACAALAFWMFGARFGTAVEKAATSNAKPALSEARKLVAQARTLFEDGDESNHENVFLAEDLLKRAESLDSTDAEVWAAQAQVSRLMSVLGYDRTRARKDALQKQAERAWKLDPASVEAQVAYASYLADVGGATAEEAIRILEPLSERQPGHRGVWGALGLAYAAAGKANELVVAFDRANALPGGDARALSIKGTQLVWFGRYAEAEAALAESLAVKSTGRAHAFGVLLKLCWRGDLDAAAADLERWPTWLRLEPRGAFVMSQVWLWRREPDKAIAALNAAPRDAWNDTYFTGPKAVLLALAHELAGRPQAARAEWENTRTVANRLLAEDPTLRAALAYKGVALARLGETAEAETLLRQLEQNQSLQAEFWSCAAPSALLRIALGHGAEVTAKFETEQRIARLKTVYPSPQAALRLNPVFEPIRATPEFQRMLAAAPAPKPRNPAAAAARVEQKSIAVLAFENRSSEKDSEYFSDGISEELLNVLSKVPGLRVAARTSSFYFKVKP
ncbi:MAG: TIR domain-containing protein, partial [Opitutaceae bacterium]|nr:TIR domain-containing protein [Opitutaceae bacterium]